MIKFLFIRYIPLCKSSLQRQSQDSRNVSEVFDNLYGFQQLLAVPYVWPRGNIATSIQHCYIAMCSSTADFKCYWTLQKRRRIEKPSTDVYCLIIPTEKPRTKGNAFLLFNFLTLGDKAVVVVYNAKDICWACTCIYHGTFEPHEFVAVL